MEKELIVNLQNSEVSEEDVKVMQEAVDNFIKEQTKLCLKKYFKLSRYNKPFALGFDFEMCVFWSLSRDCIVDTSIGYQTISVLWRVKNYTQAPKLEDITKDDKNYYFKVRLLRGKNAKTGKNRWVSESIPVPISEYERFLKDFENEIEYLKQKEYGNHQC